MISKDANILNLTEMLDGGDEPFRAVEMPELMKGGKPGVLLVKPAKAADVIAFSQLPEETDEEKEERNAAQYRLVARSLVNPAGERLMTDDDAPKLGQLPASAFMRLVKAVSEDMTAFVKDAQGGNV